MNKLRYPKLQIILDLLINTIIILNSNESNVWSSRYHKK